MSYKTLISHLKSLLETIDRSESENDASRSMLKAFWAIGKDVTTYTRETGGMIKDIALDVGEARGTLEKYVRFYRFYPNGYIDEISGHPLNWSHYAALLYMADKKAREFYLKNAALKGWSSHELRRRMRNNYYENASEAQAQKKKKGHQLKPIAQKLYTYAAKVLKIVDADTFDLDIDVGFFIKMEHRVRLRGINAPEKGTKKGDEATKFVAEQLKVGELVIKPVKGAKELVAREPVNPIVIIRSYKSMTEKFGRYLVDLWYLKGENDRERILNEGCWLNQVLLDKGLAQKVE